MDTIPELTPTPWPPADHAGYDALAGKAVYGAGGEHLGTVAAVLHPDEDADGGKAGEHRLVVTPGGLRAWFGGKTLYVPETAVSVVAGDGVGLAYPKRAIAAHGWTDPPAPLDRVV